MTPSAKSNADALHERTRRCVAICWALGTLYADDVWAPISALDLELLLERAHILVEQLPLHGPAEIVWPAICGIYSMFVERMQTKGEKALAMRHGLGHVLAGDLTDASCNHDCSHWSDFEEAAADLFAMVDLIPKRMLIEWQAVCETPGELEVYVAAELRRYVPDWPDERIADRVMLRLAL